MPEMDEAFQKRIRDDLDKSGFATEMRAMKAILSRGWQCSGSYSYFDKDESKSREIDIQAHHGLHRPITGKDGVGSIFFVVAEVKKSERPWVVFGQALSDDAWERVDAWNNLAYCGGPDGWKLQLVDALSAHSLLVAKGFRGHNIHESFKSPDQPSRWYPAFVGCCKAAESIFERNKGPMFTFVQPVVLLDGQLCAAQLSEDGQTNVSEADEIAMTFSYQSPQYKRSSYRVDLVRVQHLGPYLERCEQRQQAVVEKLVALVNGDA